MQCPLLAGESWKPVSGGDCFLEAVTEAIELIAEAAFERRDRVKSQETLFSVMQKFVTGLLPRQGGFLFPSYPQNEDRMLRDG